MAYPFLALQLAIDIAFGVLALRTVISWFREPDRRHGNLAIALSSLAVMMLLVCVAARGPDWRFPGLPRIAPAVTWLAGISYGLYLVHQELGYILARALLDLGVPGRLRLPAVLAAAVLAGWAITAGVERPVHRWLTARRDRRRKPQEPQVTDAEPVSVGGGS